MQAVLILQIGGKLAKFLNRYTDFICSSNVSYIATVQPGHGQFREDSNPPFIFDPLPFGYPSLKRFPHPPFLTKFLDVVYQPLYTRKATR